MWQTARRRPSRPVRRTLPLPACVCRSSCDAARLHCLVHALQGASAMQGLALMCNLIKAGASLTGFEPLDGWSGFKPQLGQLVPVSAVLCSLPNTGPAAGTLAELAEHVLF